MTTTLLIGAGFLGLHLSSKLEARGIAPVVTTRSPARARLLADAHRLEALTLDLADAGATRHLLARWQGQMLDVYCLVPPGACGDPTNTASGLRSLTSALAMLRVRRAVLTSSIGVYGDAGGGWVAAETKAAPRTARELRLQAIESAWLAHPGHHVLRLAGLYGPGRIIGRQALERGETIAGDPTQYLNLIHAEDAADLLIACMDHAGTARIELGSDGAPAPRHAYYTHLAGLLGAAPPRFSGTGGRSEGSRRCDPATTQRRLAWQPRHADYRAGLPAALAAEA